jgi:hypothetical protein
VPLAEKSTVSLFCGMAFLRCTRPACQARAPVSSAKDLPDGWLRPGGWMGFPWAFCSMRCLDQWRYAPEGRRFWKQVDEKYQEQNRRRHEDETRKQAVEAGESVRFIPGSFEDDEPYFDVDDFLEYWHQDGGPRED